MATRARISDLSRIFTPTYAARINAQLVHPFPSQIVKPHELQSSLARPLWLAHYRPGKPLNYLAATLAYGLIMGHPFMDGNKRTGFFLANEYMKIMGCQGLSPVAEVDANKVAELQNQVARGELGVDGLGAAMEIYEVESPCSLSEI